MGTYFLQSCQNIGIGIKHLESEVKLLNQNFGPVFEIWTNEVQLLNRILLYKLLVLRHTSAITLFPVTFELMLLANTHENQWILGGICPKTWNVKQSFKVQVNFALSFYVLCLWKIQIFLFPIKICLTCKKTKKCRNDNTHVKVRA